MKKSLIYLVFIMFIQVISANKFEDHRTDIVYDYSIVTVKPTFLGGINGFMKYVMENYNAPESEEVETGTVQVSIVISTDGTVKDIKILNDVGNAGAEIKRILSNCPKWTPGKNNGVNVPVVYKFPIKIQ